MIMTKVGTNLQKRKQNIVKPAYKKLQIRVSLINFPLAIK